MNYDYRWILTFLCLTFGPKINNFFHLDFHVQQKEATIFPCRGLTSVVFFHTTPLITTSLDNSIDSHVPDGLGTFEHVDSSQVTSVTRYVLQQVPLQNFKQSLV